MSYLIHLSELINDAGYVKPGSPGFTSGVTNPFQVTAGILSLKVSATSGNLVQVLTDGLYTSASTSSGGTGAVSAVSNSDGSLTVSPTTGSVVTSLNVAHANTWSGQQKFTVANVLIGATVDNTIDQLQVSGSTSVTYNFVGSNTPIVVSRFIGGNTNSAIVGNPVTAIKIVSGTVSGSCAAWDIVNDSAGGIMFRYSNLLVGVGTNNLFYVDHLGNSYIASTINIGSTGIATASSILSLQSTTLGFLPPSMTTAQKNAIILPAKGLLVFDNVINAICYYDGTVWQQNMPLSGQFISGSTNPFAVTGGVLSLTLSASSGNTLQIQSDGLYASGGTGIGLSLMLSSTNYQL
jgi:hypothetical protein